MVDVDGEEYLVDVLDRKKRAKRAPKKAKTKPCESCFLVSASFLYIFIYPFIVYFISALRARVTDIIFSSFSGQQEVGQEAVKAFDNTHRVALLSQIHLVFGIPLTLRVIFSIYTVLLETMRIPVICQSRDSNVIAQLLTSSPPGS
jgi:hypothetical protein